MNLPFRLVHIFKRTKTGAYQTIKDRNLPVELIRKNEFILILFDEIKSNETEYMNLSNNNIHQLFKNNEFISLK